MAYSIRYGQEMETRRAPQRIVRFQIVISVCLLLLVAALRLFWQGGAGTAAKILASPPESVTERAVSSMAEALAAGEGWYHGFAVWCRTIIDAGLA